MSKLTHAAYQAALLVLQALNVLVLPAKYQAFKPLITLLLSYVQGHLAIYNHKNGA